MLDVVSKLMPIVLTSRLQIFLEEIGTPIQFGASQNTGCPDGSFYLRSMLQMNKEHDVDTWVVFVDLVKTFDSIHYAFMFSLLENFGIPDRPLQVIKNCIKTSRSK